MGKPPRRNLWEDHYTRKARKEQFAARSVYKLQEIQKRMQLIRKGQWVLDLGCAPGSWMQYAAELVGPGGGVLGIDLKPVSIGLPPHAKAMVADIFDVGEATPGIPAHGFDVVMSDMAPATTGHRATDAARSAALCEAALGLAMTLLVDGGHFLCKIFQGSDFKAFSDDVKTSFRQQRIFKPQSSRKTSREIYIAGLGKRRRD